MIFKKSLIFVFALITVSGVCIAQQPAATPTPATVNEPAAQGKLPTVRVRSDEVNVVFTVVDKNGRFVRDLTQNDFRILDNHQAPRQITNFAAQTNLPLQVGLLIDASNSIRDRFKFEKDAASEFLYDVIRPQSDKAFVLAFDEKWDLIQDFTNNLDKLREGVKSIQAGGGTALWDAVYFSCRDKLMKETSIAPVRRAIIIVSDGDDNLSHVYRNEAIDMAQRAGVIVYTIATSLVDNDTKGNDNLKLLAEATGGRSFTPAKLDDVVAAFSDIQDELRSQYSVSYRPEGFIASGEFRPIQITADSKKYKVRAKKGYYVPKQTQAP